jgi:hypothetical protein
MGGSLHDSRSGGGLRLVRRMRLHQVADGEFLPDGSGGGTGSHPEAVDRAAERCGGSARRGKT